MAADYSERAAGLTIGDLEPLWGAVAHRFVNWPLDGSTDKFIAVVIEAQGENAVLMKQRHTQGVFDPGSHIFAVAFPKTLVGMGLPALHVKEGYDPAAGLVEIGTPAVRMTAFIDKLTGPATQQQAAIMTLAFLQRVGRQTDQTT